MPGPGGGSRGGGGFGGGFGGGGGFRGGGGFHGGGRPGGFHGGFHHGPRGPHFPFWGFRRRYYGYGGGCLSLLMLPIIFIIAAIVTLISIFGSAFGAVTEGGIIQYDEKTFQGFAAEEYDRLFGGTDAYEESIMIVLLTSEEGKEYCYIGWVGSNLDDDVIDLFGAERTALGRAMNKNISPYYAYSLSTNLKSVVNDMADSVTSLPSFTAPSDAAEAAYPNSKLVDYTELNISESVVGGALQDFSKSTGIPIAVVVEDMTDVFEVGYGAMIAGLVVVLIFVAVAVFLFVKAYRTYRMFKNNGNNGNNRQDDYDRYRGDGQNY